MRTFSLLLCVGATVFACKNSDNNTASAVDSKAAQPPLVIPAQPNSATPDKPAQSTPGESNPKAAEPKPSPQDASAELNAHASSSTLKHLMHSVPVKDAHGKKIGDVTLTEDKVKEGVFLSLHVSGLTPGQHGVHFHQNPVCERSDFKSAGDHWNPTAKHHGAKNPKGPHKGDLPNLTVDANGEGKLEYTLQGVTLAKQDLTTKSLTSLTDPGVALVIHQAKDDEQTDPSGNSGARIACAVIQPPSSTKSTP